MNKIERLTADFELATRLRDEAVSDLYKEQARVETLEGERTTYAKRLAKEQLENERLRAERDRAIREKNGLFDALRDKKPTAVNVQVASTGQQETIDKQAQRIASLEEAIKPVLAAATPLDDPEPHWCQVRIDDLEALEEALAKEQDDRLSGERDQSVEGRDALNNDSALPAPDSKAKEQDDD